MRASSLRQEMTPGLRAMATRAETAWTDLVATLAELGDIIPADAERVARCYQAQKIVKIDHVGGRYHVKHGAFFDRETIRYALSRISA